MVVVIFWKGLNLKIKIIFLDPDGKMRVLDVSSSDEGAFRPVATYALTGEGQSDYFK